MMAQVPDERFFGLVTDLESGMARRLATLQAQLEDRIDTLTTQVAGVMQAVSLPSLALQRTAQAQTDKCLVSCAARLDGDDGEKFAHAEAFDQLGLSLERRGDLDPDPEAFDQLWDAVTDVGNDLGELMREQQAELRHAEPRGAVYSQQSWVSVPESVAHLQAMLNLVMAEQAEAGRQRRSAMEAIMDIHAKLQRVLAEQLEICPLLESLREELSRESVQHFVQDRMLGDRMDGLEKGHKGLEQRLRELAEVCVPRQCPANGRYASEDDQEEIPHESSQSPEICARGVLVDGGRAHPLRSHAAVTSESAPKQGSPEVGPVDWDDGPSM